MYGWGRGSDRGDGVGVSGGVGGVGMGAVGIESDIKISIKLVLHV